MTDGFRSKDLDNDLSVIIQGNPLSAMHVNTVAIVPISTASGEKSYRAIAGDKWSVGKTTGQALDALTDQLGETEFSALLVIQSFRPDPLFNAEQQRHSH